MNQQATEAQSVVNGRPPQSLRPNGRAADTVTPNDCVLATWRALRIMIIDHRQDTASELLTLAGRCGHVSQRVCHGQAALNVAAEQRPDVVLLNLELPSLDGRLMARQLRLDSPRNDYLIVAFADWADDERRRQCGEASIDLLLVRPVDPSFMDVLLGLEWMHINRLRAA